LPIRGWPPPGIGERVERHDPNRGVGREQMADKVASDESRTPVTSTRRGT